MVVLVVVGLWIMSISRLDGFRIIRSIMMHGPLNVKLDIVYDALCGKRDMVYKVLLGK